MIQSYVVQPGDGFVAIARKLGSVQPYVDMEYIARANGMTLTSVIHPGRILWYDTNEIVTTTAPDKNVRVVVSGERRVTVDGVVRTV